MMNKLIVSIVLLCFLVSGCEKKDTELQGYVPGINLTKYIFEDSKAVEDVLDDMGLEYEIHDKKGVSIQFNEMIDNIPFTVYLDFGMDGKQLLSIEKIAYFTDENADMYLALQDDVYKKMTSLYGEMEREPVPTCAFSFADKKSFGYNYYWEWNETTAASNLIGYHEAKEMYYLSISWMGSFSEGGVVTK